MRPRDRVDVPAGTLVLTVPPCPKIAHWSALHAYDDDERGSAQQVEYLRTPQHNAEGLVGEDA